MQQTNPPPEQQQHLNAAQLAAVNQEVQRIVAGIKLRQWVVQQVLVHADSEQPTRLARELHAFIVGTESSLARELNAFIVGTAKPEEEGMKHVAR